MAPTKKKKKGTREKAGKQKKTTLPDEEKYQKTVLEVDTLKQHLVLRRDVARQAMADSEGLKQKLADLEKALEAAQGDKKDIYEEMIRQYQQLQRQTDTRIQRLEAEKENLQEQLGQPGLRSRQAPECQAQLGEGGYQHPPGVQGPAEGVWSQPPGNMKWDSSQQTTLP
ncbi:coiled-coil domain-containing protein 153 isoform X3 [Hemicordylus capensis]|uniref:coiled-coil domain-containing protein 153 isoform X3 n=1 Tax=Hemicordylus capensis TaxID=884348 RepID=UPI002303A4CD|nr:coiled-coil domain-containing protein 153 isoform X3 [Hemicordylus capensis]